MDLDAEFGDYLLQVLKEDVQTAENYFDSKIKPAVKERYAIYHADKNYYQKKFPKLSKSSSLVSTDVADTIEWCLPSLLKIFCGSDTVVTIQGVNQEDEKPAAILQDLTTYYLQRKNKFFSVLYDWFKDALITGVGFVKCYWEREEKYRIQEEVMSYLAVQELAKTGANVLSCQPADMFGNFVVQYEAMYYAKNTPRVENVLISEILYSPDAKSLDEATFVAHKKTVTLSYLKQKENEGIYSNVDKIQLENRIQTDDLEDDMNDNALDMMFQTSDRARTKVIIYECYTKVDINKDGVLEDLIVTFCGDVILRIEENYYGRHPFFSISPIKDPHRVWSKRSYANLIGELQDLKVALIRQAVNNIAQSNDPKIVMSEEAINIDDYIQGRNVIRKKPGASMADVAMPIPVTPLHPWTFQLLEFIEGQKEARTGITRYNQGLDANSLNKTATGISSIMSASNQRLELVARMFSETGFQELIRFVVSLIQKFVDQPTVIRLTNEPITIHPDDLQGEFDYIINAGMGISTKEMTMMNLQTFMTTLMQVIGSGLPVATPTNVYNLMRKWLEEAGFKNYGDYITDPAIVQQRQMFEVMLRQQALAQLPPELQAYYAETGTLPPQVLMSLPPQMQALLGGVNSGFGTGSAGAANSPSGQGSFGAANVSLSGAMVGAQPRTDNRLPQNVQTLGTDRSTF